MARLPYVIPYDPQFLGDGFRVPMPVHRCRGQLFQQGRPLDYIHASLVLHAGRRTALFTAHNIDGSSLQSVSRGGWDEDPRAGSAQLGPDAYRNNDWDRGHLVRRAAVAWGNSQVARDASDATMFYTNAALQHARFNQDEWLHLENWVLAELTDVAPRLCVFTGPIFTTKDEKTERGYRVPSAFWKVIALRDPSAAGGDVCVLGFVMKQNDLWHDWHGAKTLNLRLYQVGLRELGLYTGLDFGELAQLDEFEWRSAQFRDRSRMQPIPIRSAADIVFVGGENRRRKGLRAIPVRSALGRGAAGAPWAGAPWAEDLATEVRAVDGEATGLAPCGCQDAAERGVEVVELRKQVQVMQALLEGLLEQVTATGGQRAADFGGLRHKFERVVGGQRTELGAYQDCVCIGADSEQGRTQWFCSGVLVRKNVVLTAAHCADQIDCVFVGGRSILLLEQGQVLRVKAVYAHPDYNRDQIPAHDIAVLVLEEDADVEPVPLATRVEVDKEDNTQVVGFGHNDLAGSTGFGTKRSVDVPVAPLADLSDVHIGTIERTHGFDSQYEYLAGQRDLDRDTCSGDSGGPSYMMVGGVPKLAGLTSRSSRFHDDACGDGGIYTRITPYLAWLAEVTGDPSFVAALATDEGTPRPESQVGVLRIVAALPNPLGADAGQEWVEVRNTAAVDFVLDGCFIADRHGGRYPLQGTLAGETTLRVQLPAASPLVLANKGDLIRLFQGETLLHEVSYARAGQGDTITFDQPTLEPLPHSPPASDPPVVDVSQPTGPGGEIEIGQGPLFADPC